MLDVSFSLANLVAMLFGIIHPGSDFELDSLNGPTRKPILKGNGRLPIHVRVCNQPFRTA